MAQVVEFLPSKHEALTEFNLVVSKGNVHSSQS
jgi:hypothetical protein